MIKEKTINGTTLVFISVPEGASGFWFLDRPGNYVAWYENNKTFGEEQSTYSASKELPEGNYTIVGKGDALDGVQWTSIVGGKEVNGSLFFTDFENKKAFKRTSTEPGISILKSLGLNPSQTLILIKN